MNAHAHRVNILTNVSIIILEGYKENTTIIPQMIQNILQQNKMLLDPSNAWPNIFHPNARYCDISVRKISLNISAHHRHSKSSKIRRTLVSISLWKAAIVRWLTACHRWLWWVGSRLGAQCPKCPSASGQVQGVRLLSDWQSGRESRYFYTF